MNQYESMINWAVMKLFLRRWLAVLLVWPLTQSFLVSQGAEMLPWGLNILKAYSHVASSTFSLWMCFGSEHLEIFGADSEINFNFIDTQTLNVCLHAPTCCLLATSMIFNDHMIPSVVHTDSLRTTMWFNKTAAGDHAPIPRENASEANTTLRPRSWR